MRQLGTGGWVKYGWGTDLKDKRDSGEELVIKFETNLTPNNISPLEAAIIAVNDIITNYPPPYTLMCSGGCDSQTMIWAWHISNVKFNIVSIRYISNGIYFNEHDHNTLVLFSKINEFTVTYLDFDIIHFLENDLHEVAIANECSSPQICTHIQFSKLIQAGTILFSGNVLYHIQNHNTISDALLGLHRYAISVTNQTRAVIPFFLLHNPIFARSFDISTDTTKNISIADLYIKAKFPIIEPIQKFTGFEKVKEFYDKYSYRVTTNEKLKYLSKRSRRVFDLLFRYPYQSLDNYEAFSMPSENLKRVKI
jgi:hypothetical protein